MQDILITKLHGYILRHNPDLLLTLQHEGEVTGYLREKVASVKALSGQLQAEGQPAYTIEELCMEALTEELWKERPVIKMEPREIAKPQGREKSSSTPSPAPRIRRTHRLRL
jgi:hypothetical protein